MQKRTEYRLDEEEIMEAVIRYLNQSGIEATQKNVSFGMGPKEEWFALATFSETVELESEEATP